jgi:hypothetical protein
MLAYPSSLLALACYYMLLVDGADSFQRTNRPERLSRIK